LIWRGAITGSGSEAGKSQSLAHIALIVRDYDEAIAWFTGVLGFTLVADEHQPEQDKRWVLVAPPGAGENAATLLLARAATPEQEAFIGNQAGGRVFLFLRTDDFWRDYRRPHRQRRPLRPPSRRAALRHRRRVRGPLRQPLGPGSARLLIRTSPHSYCPSNIGFRLIYTGG
jgi:catechol 2,3-dioxygenase-like lactoylglutathione lyase family enzyme